MFCTVLRTFFLNRWQLIDLGYFFDTNVTDRGRTRSQTKSLIPKGNEEKSAKQTKRTKVCRYSCHSKDSDEEKFGEAI